MILKLGDGPIFWTNPNVELDKETVQQENKAQTRDTMIRLEKLRSGQTSRRISLGTPKCPADQDRNSVVPQAFMKRYANKYIDVHISIIRKKGIQKDQKSDSLLIYLFW